MSPVVGAEGSADPFGLQRGNFIYHYVAQCQFFDFTAR